MVPYNFNQIDSLTFGVVPKVNAIWRDQFTFEDLITEFDLTSKVI